MQWATAQRVCSSIMEQVTIISFELYAPISKGFKTLSSTLVLILFVYRTAQRVFSLLTLGQTYAQ